MRCRAEIVAEAGDGDEARITTLRSEPPLTLRRTVDGVTAVASAGGPIGGDDVRLDVRLAPEASLSFGSAAAMVVLPDRAHIPMRIAVELSVGARGSLRWLPEPTVLAHRSTCQTRVRADVGAGARLLLREVHVLGRHGEPGGALLTRLDIDYDGHPVLRQETALGEATRGWAGPAVLGSYRVLGSLVIVDPQRFATADKSTVGRFGDASWTRTPLAGGPGVLATAIGVTSLAVCRALAEAGEVSPPGGAGRHGGRDVRARLPG